MHIRKIGEPTLKEHQCTLSNNIHQCALSSNTHKCTLSNNMHQCTLSSNMCRCTLSSNTHRGAYTNNKHRCTYSTISTGAIILTINIGRLDQRGEPIIKIVCKNTYRKGALVHPYQRWEPVHAHQKGSLRTLNSIQYTYENLVNL